MTTLIILITIVIFGSAFFSGLEAALFAVSQSKVEVLKEKGSKSALALYKIKKKMSRPIAVIVIGNNIVNIVGSIYVGVIASEVLGNTTLGLISAILTFLIIVFGEIVPKTIGENHSEKISLIFATPLLFTTRILFPFIWTIERLTNRFIKPKNIVSEEEIQMMSRLGSLEGSIEDDEKEMIENVFTLNDTTASDIMTPRTVITSFEDNKSLADIKEDIFDDAFSRIPIFNENLDNILGIVHKDEILIALAKDQENRMITDFVKEAPFVSGDMKLDDLLRLFQKKRIHMAIVKNEFGGTSGVVTLEDVLEELVGEIIDETDDVVDTRAKARKQHEDSDIEVH